MTNIQILYIVVLILLILLIAVIFLGVKTVKNYLNVLNRQITETSVQNYNSLSKQIKDSIEPKFINISPTTQGLVEAAIEVWRLEKRVSKVSKDLSDDQNKAFENSIAKLKRFLDTNDLTFADYTDQKYNEGLNFDVLSIEKDSSISDSIIKETHEPAIFHKGRLIKKAKVVVLEK